MRPAKLRRHCEFVVQIRKARLRIQCTRVQNRLRSQAPMGALRAGGTRSARTEVEHRPVWQRLERNVDRWARKPGPCTHLRDTARPCLRCPVKCNTYSATPERCVRRSTPPDKDRTYPMHRKNIFNKSNELFAEVSPNRRYRSIFARHVSLDSRTSNSYLPASGMSVPHRSLYQPSDADSLFTDEI